ncbi:MAG: hypothetical protein AB7K24_23725, partial [Gemmataceae bacterium]
MNRSCHILLLLTALLAVTVPACARMETERSDEEDSTPDQPARNEVPVIDLEAVQAGNEIAQLNTAVEAF